MNVVNSLLVNITIKWVWLLDRHMISNIDYMTFFSLTVQLLVYLMCTK